MTDIVQAELEQVQDVRDLLLEYATDLADDAAVCAEGLEQELASPLVDGAMYAPPRGRFLLAMDGDEVAGGVGLRELGPETAELRRLYVRPAYRGCQLGRWLAMAAVNEAQQLGYRRVRLETVPSMVAAQRLYESMGFQEVAGSAGAPVRVMELELHSEGV